MSGASDLNELLRSRRVILCVGCGGVGKTTTCAALGLAAARAGKRALCLTIDPAQRLAESLGLGQIDGEAREIEPAVFERAGIRVSGSLTVMMLDTKTTFDRVVSSLAGDARKRESVFHNVIYQYIATSLAGTQEYAAMERLYELKDDPAYDLVLLDTPPTSHALEFLDAPHRLVDAFDSPAVRWFVKAFADSGSLSLNLLQRSAATILRGIGRITGGSFLEQMAGFLSEVSSMFGGWRQHADEVAAALCGPEVGYVLVTTPAPLPLREVLFFAGRLREQNMRADGYVVNRMHRTDGRRASAAEVRQAAEQRGLTLSDATLERVLAAAAVAERRAELDRLHLVALDEIFGGEGGGAEGGGAEGGGGEGGGGDAGPAVAYVPDFPADIHDLTRLVWVADALAPAAGSSAV